MTTATAGVEPIAFDLPNALIATEPAERRGSGRRRDDVRLMVARRHDRSIEHATFADLPRFLDPGDLVVVNTSTTRAAAVPTADGLLVHLSTRLGATRWLVELREPCRAGSLRHRGGRPGQTVALPGGGSVRILAPHTPGDDRLWVAEVDLAGGTDAYLARHGRPIRYGCAENAIDIAAYQTIFAAEPGSAEMPSAGRPFTTELLAGLARRGVRLATVVLHAGVSSAEVGEAPYAEWFRVPVTTAALANATRRAGRRVVAVGTTVTRALESAVAGDGLVHPSEGWTELMVTPDRGARVVDALITGWHEPLGSHLLLVEAIAGRPLLERSYAAALSEGYLWHEFGDAHLILGGGPAEGAS